MPPLRQVSSFFARLILYYAVFLALWSWAGLDRIYSPAFQKAGTNLFLSMHAMGGRWMVMLHPPPTPGGNFDTEIVVGNPSTGALGRQPLNAQYLGFASTSMVLTLILASPVTWRRRGWACLWGLILVHGWIAIGLMLLVIHAYSTPGPLALYSVSAVTTKTLAFLAETMVTSTVGRYAVPVFFWLLVTFRRPDWQRFSESTSSNRFAKRSSSDLTTTRR